MRQQFKGTILAVEGSTDFRLFKSLVDNGECYIQSCDGKNNVLDVVKQLEDSQFKGILGIIDADFWRIIGKSSPTQNILLTDTHDLDSMLVFSEALDKVLSELIHSDKFKSLKVPLIEAIKSAAYPIGLLRLINEKYNGSLQISFIKMNYEAFLNKNDLSIDIKFLLANLKSVSQGHKLDIKSLAKQLYDLLAQKCDILQVCTGDDLIEIIVFGLKYNFGNARAPNITKDLLNMNLRLAYNKEHFKDTALYREIKAWETLNVSFKVLATF